MLVKPPLAQLPERLRARQLLRDIRAHEHRERLARDSRRARGIAAEADALVVPVSPSGRDKTFSAVVEGWSPTGFLNEPDSST